MRSGATSGVLPSATWHYSIHRPPQVLRQLRSFNVFSAVIVTILLLQALCVPQCRGTYRLPVKQFHALEHVSRVRREALSPDARAHMENNLNGISGNGYYIDVNIGTPPQKMRLLIDTGSANLAVACERGSNVDRYFHRDRSSSFEDQDISIKVQYTTGEWTGQLGTDVVGISTAPNLSATAYVSCITESKDFYVQDADWQGILGLSYAALSRPDPSYVPLWDSLVEENPELDDVFSMQLCGNSFVHTKDKPLMDGSLILGGIDQSMTKSEILYAPIYKEWYYEVVLTGMEVAGSSLDLDCKEYNLDKTIVDSGTTTIRLAVKAFDTLVASIQRSISANNRGMLPEPEDMFYRGETVQCYSDMEEPFRMFPVVSFYLLHSHNSSFRLDLTPQHYLRAVEPADTLAMEAGIPLDQVCVKFGFSPSQTGTVIGAVLMEAFYVVFDRNASRIGFGQTTCPLPDPDYPILEKTIGGPYYTNKNLDECAYKKPETAHRAFLVATYVMAAICIAVILPMVFVFFSWSRRMSRRQDGYQQSFAN